jgi:hypothetical protein
MISKFTCGMMHNYRRGPTHCQRISKYSGALFLTDFSLLRLKILHRSKKVPAKRWNCFFKNIYNDEKITKDATSSCKAFCDFGPKKMALHLLATNKTAACIYCINKQRGIRAK